MDIWQAFERTAEAYPFKEAIVEGDSRLTYAELRELVERCAAGLQGAGIGPGGRLALIADTSLRHCVVTLACQALHAMSVHVVPRLKPVEMAVFLNDAQPGLVLGTVELPDVEVAAVRLDDDASWSRLVRGERSPQLPAADEQALSNMMYTSGTTGQPKGVPLTHRQTYERVLAGTVHTGVSSRDRVLGAMPLFHQMGMIGNFMLAMVVGATYYPVARMLPAAVLELIERERLTAFFGSPTHWAMLAGDPSLHKRDLTSFRKGAYAGAAMRLDQLEFWNQRLDSELIHVYGTSETMWTLINPDTRTRPEITGRPGLHHWLRVAETGVRDPKALVSDGEEGELIVKVAGPGASDECFAAYWRNPESFAESVIDGWYFTGDSARRDASGDYTITGRIKNIIRTGAEWVHPEEVERVLSAHPAVADVAVIGVPDPVWGETVSALVVPRMPVTDAEIEQFCRDHPQLAAYKRPRRIALVETIPRNVSGKLIRSEAVAIFETV